MVVSYHIIESAPWQSVNDVTLVRIIDRKQVLITTHLGAVYISRQDAARCLNEARRRKHHPFVSAQGNATSLTYEKEITP